MPPHKLNMLRIFLAKIMRSTAFDYFKYRVAKKRGGGEIGLVLEELAECIADKTDVEDQVIAPARTQFVPATLLFHGVITGNRPSVWVDRQLCSGSPVPDM